MTMKLAGLHQQLRPYAEYTVALARHYGLTPTVTSVRRTWTEQQALYDRYLRGESRWPAAPPGRSAHEYGLAWDSSVPASQQEAWNYIRRAMGWEVLENDIIHAQYPNWRSVVQFP